MVVNGMLIYRESIKRVEAACIRLIRYSNRHLSSMTAAKAARRSGDGEDVEEDDEDDAFMRCSHSCSSFLK